MSENICHVYFQMRCQKQRRGHLLIWRCTFNLFSSTLSFAARCCAREAGSLNGGKKMRCQELWQNNVRLGMARSKVISLEPVPRVFHMLHGAVISLSLLHFGPQICFSWSVWSAILRNIFPIDLPIFWDTGIHNEITFSKSKVMTLAKSHDIPQRGDFFLGDGTRLPSLTLKSRRKSPTRHHHHTNMRRCQRSPPVAR